MASSVKLITVPVVGRSADPDVPLRSTTGYVPFEDCPLAVTRYGVWDATKEVWSDGNEWQITHRATGYTLGQRTWRTRDEAAAVLERCDPTFAAWAAVQADVTDAALVACQMKFRMAVTTAAQGAANGPA